MNDSTPCDDTDYLHERLEADSAANLDSLIQAKQVEGFELVNVVFDGTSWHAFMKCYVNNCDYKLHHELMELNAGVGMLINNNPGFVTKGKFDEMQYVMESILSELQSQDS